MIRGRMVYGIYLAKYAVAEVKTLKARCILSGIRVTQHQLIAYAIKQGIARYGVGNVVIWAKNLGRQQGVRYYMYDVKYAKWEQGSDKSG